MKQIIFVDDWKNAECGILLDDGNCLCGCCGGLIKSDDFRILKAYDEWVNLADGAICDRGELLEQKKRFEKMSDAEFFEWFRND